MTIRACLLGALLSLVLGAANAYLGLFAGMTVSASIPAAVASMAVFRFLKTSSVQESNLVQTAASAGEALAAGVIFTIPALLLMGFWSEFRFFDVVAISLSSGLLGVVLCGLFRQTFIVEQELQYPEGIATAQVLQSGQEGPEGFRLLLSGGVVGALVKLGESGFNLWQASLATVGKFTSWHIFFGINLSPALLGVGYIVGLRVAGLVFLGGALSWWLAIPAYLLFQEAQDLSLLETSYDVWNKQIRYLGVGAMVLGGLWTLIELRSSIVQVFRRGRAGLQGDTRRNFFGLAFTAFAIYFAICFYFLQVGQSFSSSLAFGFLVLALAFLASLLAAYLAGIVGSSNNPISGVTIAAVVFSSVLLLVFLDPKSQQAPALAVLLGAFVCIAGAIAGDTMQDLKCGHLLRAKPLEQQFMQCIGVVVAAFSIPFVLSILDQAYGIGSKKLPAPQATLIQSVASGVFSGELPWLMAGLGALIALLIIIIGKLTRSQIPVLAVAVGLYLPFELSSAILCGGLLKAALEQKNANTPKQGILFASGLITGEALLGIGIAAAMGLF